VAGELRPVPPGDRGRRQAYGETASQHDRPVLGAGRDQPDLAGGLAEDDQPLVAGARPGGITGELVTSGYSGQRQSGSERHPETLEGAACAVEEGPGGGVVAFLLGDDGRAVGGEHLAGVVTDLVGHRAGAAKHAEASVFIAGGGPIGVLAALYAQAAGAARIIVSEPNEYRRAFLERLDVGHVIDPGAAGFHEALLDLTDGLGADVAVECSATEAGLTTVLEGVRTRGKISQVALHVRPALIDPMLLYRMSLTIEGIWCYPTDDWPRIMSLIATGRFPVERAVSHEIPLGAAVQDGFDELCSPASTAVKVLIKI